ncbi:unnamed protein product [Paramecium sonneborni]|uniref:WD40-repeat-containing domain n=1 Tax=Paramecium sonneborni TaxID=65129 RepID=A0A8S1NGG8_9CILI|nr:unnamed protein product [Paramecium sonneborni]
MQQNYKQNPNIYELLPEVSTKMTHISYANAINQQKTLIIIGAGRKIKVFEIPYINGQPGQMKEIQKLKEHSNDVVSLKFFNLPNQNDSFISGASMVDNSIIIWQKLPKQDSSICYGLQYRLKGHSDQVSQLLIHPIREDIIISGSQDSTIKFWSKDHQWTCQQTFKDFSRPINDMAINYEGNKLVSCSDEKFLLIMEPNQQSQWYVKQKIKFPQEIIRICFITNDLLTVLPNKGTKLHFFVQNQHQHFIKSLDHLNLAEPGDSCFGLFPPCYSQITETLIIKNGNKLNLVNFKFPISKEGIKIKESEEFWTCKLQQVIELQDSFMFGSMSLDGQYIVLWDIRSFDIQIRKYISQS